MAKMADDGGKIRRVAVAQKQRDTSRREQLGDLMQHGLGHRLATLADPDAQHQLGLRIDGCPHPRW